MSQPSRTVRPVKALARVEAALRSSPMTAAELCAELGVCHTSVATALADLQRYGLVSCIDTQKFCALGRHRKVWGIAA